jgi:hypothetical protein
MRTLLFALPLLLVSSCGKGKPDTTLPASNVPEKFYLADAPGSARSVAEVVSSAKDGEQVVVTGRVGGAEKVFVDSYAAFTIVDAKVSPCGAGEMDECQTPWDYCCDSPDVIAANALSVELISDGQPLKATARGYHGLDHLKMVVVQGTVAKDSTGNVRVLATGLHVQP